MVDSDARRLLAALAGGAPAEDSDGCVAMEPTDYCDSIDRAIAATEDLDAATAFLSDTDLVDLSAAIDRADRDLSTRAEEGQEALDRLRELRTAALGGTDVGSESG